MVVDSTNLEKSLYLALQLKEIGHEFIIALNMMDVATKRGLELDKEKLANIFSCEVVETISHDKEKVKNLIEKIDQQTQKKRSALNLEKTYQTKIKDPDYIKAKFKEIDKVLDQIIIKKIKPDTLTQSIDHFVLHPVMGIVILLAALIIKFKFLFSWSDPAVGLIESCISG